MIAFAVPTAVDVRTMAADASLLLLVGGLAMMCVIMLLVTVQNLVPERAPPGNLGFGRNGDNLPRLWPRRPSRPATTPAIDKVMARIGRQQLGEPRILQARSLATRLRLYACPGCLAEPGTAPGCTRERAGVEQAFRDVYGGRVTVWETSCRLRGDEACDFEVKHGRSS